MAFKYQTQLRRFMKDKAPMSPVRLFNHKTLAAAEKVLESWASNFDNNKTIHVLYVVIIDLKTGKDYAAIRLSPFQKKAYRKIL